MDFLDDLPEDTQQRFEQTLECAEGKFNRSLQRAARTRENFFGIDFGSPWERRETLVREQKQAALEYLGDLLFFVIDVYASVTLAGQELIDRMNVTLAAFRQVTFDCRWPKIMSPDEYCARQQEQEFDRDLIQWLEGREEWKRYEAQVLPEIAFSANAQTNRETSTPLLYVDRWPLESLPTRARQRIRAELLEIHGNVLDENVRGEECWRRTYDVIAEAYAGAGLLSDDLLTHGIPGMVADAAAGGGWSSEPLGQVRPTGIFNTRLGSQFYPLWRYRALVESLGGRIAHWRGRLLLRSSHLRADELRRGRRPLTETHKSVASMIADLGHDWKHGANLQRLAEWMDSARIEVEARSRKAGIDTWVEKLAVDPVNFIKAIEYRLRQAKK